MVLRPTLRRRQRRATCRRRFRPMRRRRLPTYAPSTPAPSYAPTPLPTYALDAASDAVDAGRTLRQRQCRATCHAASDLRAVDRRHQSPSTHAPTISAAPAYAPSSCAPKRSESFPLTSPWHRRRQRRATCLRRLRVTAHRTRQRSRTPVRVLRLLRNSAEPAAQLQPHATRADLFASAASDLRVLTTNDVLHSYERANGQRDVSCDVHGNDDFRLLERCEYLQSLWEDKGDATGALRVFADAVSIAGTDGYSHVAVGLDLAMAGRKHAHCARALAVSRARALSCRASPACDTDVRRLRRSGGGGRQPRARGVHPRHRLGRVVLEARVHRRHAAARPALADGVDRGDGRCHHRSLRRCAGRRLVIGDGARVGDDSTRA